MNGERPTVVPIRGEPSSAVVAARLRELAGEIEADGNVRAALVVLDCGTYDFRTYALGSLLTMPEVAGLFAIAANRATTGNWSA